MQEEFVIVDKIKWRICLGSVGRTAQALCPTHLLRLTYAYDFSKELFCAECVEPYTIPREIRQEILYILNKIDSKNFKKMKFLNLDDEALPVAESKISSKDSKYFVTALLTESKLGLRLVVYAGEKGKKEKTQIFVEPEIKRLAFDQKDLHPTEVFSTLEATFNDGTKNAIKKG